MITSAVQFFGKKRNIATLNIHIKLYIHNIFGYFSIVYECFTKFCFISNVILFFGCYFVSFCLQLRFWLTVLLNKPFAKTILRDYSFEILEWSNFIQLHIQWIHIHFRKLLMFYWIAFYLFNSTSSCHLFYFQWKNLYMLLLLFIFFLPEN